MLRLLEWRIRPQSEKLSSVVTKLVHFRALNSFPFAEADCCHTRSHLVAWQNSSPSKIVRSSLKANFEVAITTYKCNDSSGQCAQ